MLFLKANDHAVWGDISKAIMELTRRKMRIKTIIWNPQCCYSVWVINEFCPHIKYTFDPEPFFLLAFSADVIEGEGVLPF